jgi:hypothetical protein
MTPRTEWQRIRFDGLNHTLVVGNLPQNVEQYFAVVARPVGANHSARPDLAVAYTATTGTPEYQKEAQLQDDNTIFATLGGVVGVLAVLIIVALIARRRLVSTFQSQRDGTATPHADPKDVEAFRERMRAKQAKMGESLLPRPAAAAAAASGAAE